MKYENILIEESNQEEENYDNHDCKNAPDSGCQVCTDYMDRNHIPDPEGGE